VHRPRLRTAGCLGDPIPVLPSAHICIDRGCPHPGQHSARSTPVTETRRRRSAFPLVTISPTSMPGTEWASDECSASSHSSQRSSSSGALLSARNKRGHWDRQSVRSLTVTIIPGCASRSGSATHTPSRAVQTDRAAARRPAGHQIVRSSQSPARRRIATKTPTPGRLSMAPRRHSKTVMCM
jgi:hypothetical protein